uniref:Putative ovule protein n=1 Tax=Solanum chacoense TaxID=4108 RepID=A0A0V0IST6_SOLCH
MYKMLKDKNKINKSHMLQRKENGPFFILTKFGTGSIHTKIILGINLYLDRMKTMPATKNIFEEICLKKGLTNITITYST